MATFASCPTQIVEAPADTVWGLLTEMAGWGDFFDLRVLSVEPPGPAVVGQRLRGESGPRALHLAVSFVYTVLDRANYKLEMEVKLPLGLTVHEALDCVPLDGARCRVNYHCNFGIPGGWRGAMVRIFLGRELVDGPIESLARLKRAAEAKERAQRSIGAAT